MDTIIIRFGSRFRNLSYCKDYCSLIHTYLDKEIYKITDKKLKIIDDYNHPAIEEGSNMKKIQDIDTAIHQFEKAAIAHSEATVQCDYRKCNKAHDIVIKAVTFIRKQKKIVRLLPFLHHHSVGVQTWAATYLLSVRPLEAIKTLEDIIKSHNGILAFGAEMVLMQYRNGTLSPFYTDEKTIYEKTMDNNSNHFQFNGSKIRSMINLTNQPNHNDDQNLTDN